MPELKFYVFGYKESNEDYCRGCLMESWSSDFRIKEYPISKDEAIEFAADIMAYDADRGE